MTKSKVVPAKEKKPTRVRKLTPAPTPLRAPAPAPADQRLRVELAALIESHQSEVAGLQAQIEKLQSELSVAQGAVEWRHTLLSEVAQGHVVDLMNEIRKYLPQPPRPPVRPVGQWDSPAMKANLPKQGRVDLIPESGKLTGRWLGGE